jgi:hypothetical protein
VVDVIFYSEMLVVFYLFIVDPIMCACAPAANLGAAVTSSACTTSDVMTVSYRCF